MMPHNSTIVAATLEVLCLNREYSIAKYLAKNHLDTEQNFPTNQHSLIEHNFIYDRYIVLLLHDEEQLQAVNEVIF